MEDWNRMIQAIREKMEVIDSRLRRMESGTWKHGSRRGDKGGKGKEVMVGLDKLKAPPQGLKETVIELKEGGNYFTYADAFVDWASKANLSDEDLVTRFVEGLKNQNLKRIAILNPRTLQQAISYGRVLTTNIDPKATRREETSVVAEVRKPNDRLEGKELSSMSNAKESMGEEDDLQLQIHDKPQQAQNHKPLIYQPPHKRFSPAETKERRIADSFVDKGGRLGTSRKDRKEDSGGLQGLSNGVTWLGGREDDESEGMETMLDAGLNNPNNENQSSDVNRFGCNYWVTIKEGSGHTKRVDYDEGWLRKLRRWLVPGNPPILF